jgi:hypothetical protein
LLLLWRQALHSRDEAVPIQPVYQLFQYYTQSTEVSIYYTGLEKAAFEYGSPIYINGGSPGMKQFQSNQCINCSKTIRSLQRSQYTIQDVKKVSKNLPFPMIEAMAEVKQATRSW